MLSTMPCLFLILFRLKKSDVHNRRTPELVAQDLIHKTAASFSPYALLVVFFRQGLRQNTDSIPTRISGSTHTHTQTHTHTHEDLPHAHTKQTRHRYNNGKEWHTTFV